MFKSFEKNILKDIFNNLVLDLRNEIGLNQTVWRVKNFEGKIKWEIYFYRNYQKNKVNLKNLKEILKKYFKVDDLVIDENLPYIMFSFDLEENRHIENAHIYFGKFLVNSFHAWSYEISSKKVEFENHYEFFSSKQIQDISHKILFSPFINTKINISQILSSNLMKCKSICIASKRDANGIYYQVVFTALFN